MFFHRVRCAPESQEVRRVGFPDFARVLAALVQSGTYLFKEQPRVLVLLAFPVLLASWLPWLLRIPSTPRITTRKPRITQYTAIPKSTCSLQAHPSKMPASQVPEQQAPMEAVGANAVVDQQPVRAYPARLTASRLRIASNTAPLRIQTSLCFIMSSSIAPSEHG